MESVAYLSKACRSDGSRCEISTGFRRDLYLLLMERAEIEEGFNSVLAANCLVNASWLLSKCVLRVIITLPCNVSFWMQYQAVDSITDIGELPGAQVDDPCRVTAMTLTIRPAHAVC